MSSTASITDHVTGIPWVSQKPKLGCCEAPPKCVVRSGRCKSHFLHGYTEWVGWCDMSMHPFMIYVILYLYYRFLCSISSLCCCKRKRFGIPLGVLKLMSLILVKLNCPVRDDLSFLTWGLRLHRTACLQGLQKLTCTGGSAPWPAGPAEGTSPATAWPHTAPPASPHSSGCISAQKKNKKAVRPMHPLHQRWHKASDKRKWTNHGFCNYYYYL